MKRILLLYLAGLLLFGAVSPAEAEKRKLNDAEMDQVTAAGVWTEEVVDGVIRFHFEGRAGRSHTVNGSGTIELLAAELPLNAATLILRDNAQGNLRSLINVNAVNSLIQVLVNLNININSTVGSVQQINLTREF